MTRNKLPVIKPIVSASSVNIIRRVAKALQSRTVCNTCKIRPVVSPLSAMAAVTTATITIKNKSTGFKRFLLFLEAPQLSHGPNGDVFHNVYQRSPKVQSGEHSLVEFQVDDRWFAVYGTSSNNDIGSPRVYTGDSVPVKPGPDGTVAVLSTSDGDPYWDDTAAQGKSTSTQGGFTIITDASFKTLNEST